MDNCLILFHYFLSKKRQSTIWLYLFSSMLKMSCRKLLKRKLCICFKSPSVILSHCLFDWLSCGIHVKCVCLYKYLERRKLTTTKELEETTNKNQDLNHSLCLLEEEDHDCYVNTFYLYLIMSTPFPYIIILPYQ